MYALYLTTQILRLRCCSCFYRYPKWNLAGFWLKTKIDRARNFGSSGVHYEEHSCLGTPLKIFLNKNKLIVRWLYCVGFQNCKTTLLVLVTAGCLWGYVNTACHSLHNDNEKIIEKLPKRRPILEFISIRSPHPHVSTFILAAKESKGTNKTHIPSLIDLKPF